MDDTSALNAKGLSESKKEGEKVKPTYFNAYLKYFFFLKTNIVAIVETPVPFRPSLEETSMIHLGYIYTIFFYIFFYFSIIFIVLHAK